MDSVKVKSENVTAEGGNREGMWGRKDLGTNIISEEGNGSPLQCSCLENPVDRGAWWAAVHGVAQSRTRLKRLSSSRSIISCRKE